MLSVAYSAGQLVADLDDLLLEVERVRREQLTIGRVAVGLAGRRAAVGPDASGSSSMVAVPSATSATIFIAAHRPVERDSSTAWRPSVERLGGIGRVKHRQVEVGEQPGADDEGRVELLAAGSSPTSATAPPMRRGAGVDRVAERVGGAVDPGGLAVPDAHDAVVAGVGLDRRELGAHHRRGGVLLVHRRLEDDR